eukprot:CAMPEP_0194548292 /NCGR_PEP_ID=MMETSP0253-20130528/93409_1 /TAXON_ID=2966 /ORGANISM="Noctiluca scintillans" /LENGTH=103 /DNA_ID=CAMNT_0039395587 /DNA_START=60 /DNA_END=369 /DNA_ORIENTATION=+
MMASYPDRGAPPQHDAKASTDDPMISLAVEVVEEHTPASRVRSKHIISEMAGVSPWWKAFLNRKASLESARGAPRVHRALARGTAIDVIRQRRQRRSILKDDE